MSKDVVSKRKIFAVKRKPDTATMRNVLELSSAHLYSVTRTYPTVQFHNKEKNSTSVVNYNTNHCTCKQFAKKGFCKHIVYVYQNLNKECNIIDIVRTFRFRGNTKKAKRDRGRVALAKSALQRN